MSPEYMPIEKYYALKSTLECIWGKGTYSVLKHCTNLRTWKRFAARTLQASLLAIQETVQVTDDCWQEAAERIVTHGIQRIESAREFDDLFESLAASYIELSFHQIGFVPRLSTNVRRTLRKQEWKLDVYRTPQYVQSPQQKEALSRHVKRVKEAEKPRED